MFMKPLGYTEPLRLGILEPSTAAETAHPPEMEVDRWHQEHRPERAEAGPQLSTKGVRYEPWSTLLKGSIYTYTHIYIYIHLGSLRLLGFL